MTQSKVTKVRVCRVCGKSFFVKARDMKKHAAECVTAVMAAQAGATK